MKVILLQDVAKIGRRFEVTDVPDGYALNKLIPQKMAEPATPENMKRVQARAQKIESERVAADVAFDEALEALADREIQLEVEANENGHLFKAVSAKEIVSALSDEGVTVTVANIVIPTPIKEVGPHRVELVSGDKKTGISIEITAK